MESSPVGVGDESKRNKENNQKGGKRSQTRSTFSGDKTPRILIIN